MAHRCYAGMIAHFTKPFFIVGWAIYLFIRLDRSNGRMMPDWFLGFVPDLLCLPLVLWIALFVLRKYQKDNSFVLSVPMIMVAVVAFSVLFEWILPMKNSIYTQDPFDVVAYVIGGVVFWGLQKKST